MRFLEHKKWHAFGKAGNSLIKNQSGDLLMEAMLRKSIVLSQVSLMSGLIWA